MKKLKYKRIRGLIKVLKAMKYRDCPVYIRMIGSEVFMYDVIIKNQLYSSYIVIKPSQGKDKLTEKEIQQSMGLINAGAQTTIDTLLGVQLDEKKERIAKIVSGVQ
jgi:hypothetical protein